MEYWFNKNKLISLRFFPQHCNKVCCKSNGAIKGKDKCYDYNINILGLFFSYTNFDFSKSKGNANVTNLKKSSDRIIEALSNEGNLTISDVKLLRGLLVLFKEDWNTKNDSEQTEITDYDIDCFLSVYS